MTNAEIVKLVEKIETKIDNVLEKVDEVKESVNKNATKIAEVTLDLKNHKKGKLRDNAYIAIITVVITVCCLLMGYIWGREINKQENVRTEESIQGSSKGSN